MSFSTSTSLNNLLGLGEDYLAILNARNPYSWEGTIGYAFINTMTNQKFIKINETTWKLDSIPNDTLQFSTNEYLTYSTDEYLTLGE